mgnify:CR=1 FL=1
MKPVLTADEYNRIDKAYEGDLDAAMDKAGYAVALAAVRAGAGYGSRVSVLAGVGNNGGDGYVAARYLVARGARVTVHALDLPRSPEASRAARTARAAGVRMTKLAEPDAADLVIDALFGGGVRGGLPLPIFGWIANDAPVVAVDYPTGLDPNTGKVEERAFRAVETVTFGTLKTGHLLADGPDHCGRVTVADIGIDGGEPSMYVATAEDTERPGRARRTHKWDAGAVMVVGGSAGISGAAVLAAKGALSFGAGAVAIAAPDRSSIISQTLEFPTFDLDEAIGQIDRFDTVIFGPGLGENDLDPALPLLESARTLVVDAGGLVPKVGEIVRESGKAAVLTPHAGEFKRLSASEASGTYAVRALARKLGATVLLKGSPNRVSDGNLPVLVTTGGPELATIGTGDVLAGMIGALMARGVEPTRAAVTAAYYHGIAGGEVASEGALTAEMLACRIRGFAW